MKEYKMVTIKGTDFYCEFEKTRFGYYCNEIDGMFWNFTAWGVNLPCKTRRAAALRFWRKIK